jgi:hypothetical protein
LHLGCGNDYWPGWLNIDSSARADCDLRADFGELGRIFEPGSVAEIAMIHSLGYLNLWQARLLFTDAARVLVPGGAFVAEFPDLAKCAAHALSNLENRHEYLEAVRGLYAFDESYIAEETEYVPYAFGWSGEHLCAELLAAGFRQATVAPPVTHGPRLWRDTRVEGVR